MDIVITDAAITKYNLLTAAQKRNIIKLFLVMSHSVNSGFSYEKRSGWKAEGRNIEKKGLMDCKVLKFEDESFLYGFLNPLGIQTAIHAALTATETHNLSDLQIDAIIKVRKSELAGREFNPKEISADYGYNTELSKYIRTQYNRAEQKNNVYLTTLGRAVSYRCNPNLSLMSDEEIERYESKNGARIA